MPVFNDRYATSAIWWHWLLAILIFILYAMGWYMVEIPKGTPPVAFWYNLHKSIGLVSAAPLILLIAWRTRHVPPPLPRTLPPWQVKASYANHLLFYICMVVLIVSGFVESNFTKYGIKFFGYPLPIVFREDKTLYGIFNRVHVYTSYLFAVLIAIHAGAAVKHLIFDRDGVFQRMLPLARR